MVLLMLADGSMSLMASATSSVENQWVAAAGSSTGSKLLLIASVLIATHNGYFKNIARLYYSEIRRFLEYNLEAEDFFDVSERFEKGGGK